MPRRVIADVPHWSRSQSNPSSLLSPGRAERQGGTRHCAWLASPTKVGRRAAPGEMEYALRAFWRWQWGPRDMRRTWGCESSHTVGGLTVNPAGEGGGRGGIAQQEV